MIISLYAFTWPGSGTADGSGRAGTGLTGASGTARDAGRNAPGPRAGSSAGALSDGSFFAAASGAFSSAGNALSAPPKENTFSVLCGVMSTHLTL